MHFFVLDQIAPLLEQYRYALLFPITVLEGPIITVIAGYLTSLGFFSFWTVYVIVVSGDLVGDILYYFFGRLGHLTLVEKWSLFVRADDERLERMKKVFSHHSAKALFWGKFTFGVGGLIILAAGAARVKFFKFLGYCTLGTLPKSLILVLIGYYFGYAYKQISKYFDYTAVLFMAAAVLLAFGYYLIQKYARKNIGSPRL